MATLNRLAPGRVHPRHRHRQHRHAHDGPAADADRRRIDEYLRVLSGAPARRDRRLHVQRRDPADQDPDARQGVHEPRAAASRSTSRGSGRARWSWPGEYGDGLVFAIPPRGVPVAEALGHARAGRRARAGRDSTASRTARSPISRSSSRASPPTPSGCSAPSARTSWPASTISTTRCTSAASIRRPSSGRMWKRYCALVEADPARAPALPHPRVPLHAPASGRGRADRRRPGPRHLPGRHRGRAGRADPGARAPGPAGADVRHRRRRASGASPRSSRAA